MVALLFIVVVGVLLVVWSPRWSNNREQANNRLSVSRDGSPGNQSVEKEVLNHSPESAWGELDDPSADGWHTEVFSDNAMDKLKKLGKHILQPSAGEIEWSEVAGPNFSCQHLLPQELQTVFQDFVVHVQRLAKPDQAHKKSPKFTGAPGLREALDELAAPFQGATDVRFKFKLFRVEPSADSVTTQQYFAISGHTPNGMLEQNATWTAQWDIQGKPLTEANPKLTSLDVIAFEQVRNANPNGTLFSDCTGSVLQSNECYRRHLLRGYNHWLERTESRPYWERLSTPGLAVGDVNGDGWEDLYLCQERGLPNLLLLQNADGTVRDVSHAAQVDWLEDSRSVLLVDLDNDSDQDLLVAVSGGVVVAENDGVGKFSVRTVLPTKDDTKSMCAADYDRDGRIDIYVTVYYPNVFDGEMEVTGVAAANAHQVLYDTNRGGENSLFKNEIGVDGWNFVDVTAAIGLDVNNQRYSLAAAWEDYDNDGDQDLYVANDYGRNNLYRNNSGVFEDISEQAAVEDYNFAMSVTWGDYNRDGMMDIYIGNMYSAAGNRVTFQNQFKQDASAIEKDRFKHLARGNTLFQNTESGQFNDVSDAVGVTMGRWAWSTNFADLNNDGWQDLVIANGMITTEDTGDC